MGTRRLTFHGDGAEGDRAGAVAFGETLMARNAALLVFAGLLALAWVVGLVAIWCLSAA